MTAFLMIKKMFKTEGLISNIVLENRDCITLKISNTTNIYAKDMI